MGTTPKRSPGSLQMRLLGRLSCLPVSALLHTSDVVRLGQLTVLAVQCHQLVVRSLLDHHAPVPSVLEYVDAVSVSNSGKSVRDNDCRLPLRPLGDQAVQGLLNQLLLLVVEGARRLVQ